MERQDPIRSPAWSGMSDLRSRALASVNRPAHRSIAVATLWRVALILLAAGCVFLMAGIAVIESRFDAFDTEQYGQELGRVAAVLDSDSASLAALVNDYARWDDTYHFIASPGRAYVESNLTADSLGQLYVDGLFITSRAGATVVGLEYERGAQRLLPADKQQVLAARIGAAADQPAEVHLAWHDRRPVLVASAPVTDSNARLPSNGRIHMFRYVDGRYREHVENIARVRFDIAPGTQGGVIVVERHGDRWLASRGFHGTAAVSVGGPTRLAQERRVSGFILTGNAFVLVLVSLAGVSWVVRRTVLARLSHFSALADEVHATGDQSIRWPVAGNDELDNLALSLNSLRDSVAQREQALNHAACYDPLTGLPSRRMLLLDRVPRALAAAARSGEYGALVLLDLDNFKVLNDTRGHAEGDRFLVEVTRRICANVRETDTVSRLGGDEFVILLEELAYDGLAAAVSAERIAQKVVDALSAPYLLSRGEHASTVSIGITLFGDAQATAETLLQQADMAMYRAKASGRNRMCLFDPQMQADVNERADMEADLAVAIREGQLRLWYQAQVDHEERVSGAEALLRWWHPVRGFVSPAKFIPLAEDTGLILPVGRWVLVAACEQLRRWADDPLLAGLTVAVNVSARQIHHPGFVGEVQAVLRQTGANPHRLKLELTEGVMVEDIEGVIAKMQALTAVGIVFSIDDFGTGYSSLSYLKRLPLAQLKIDQGFVRNVLVDESDAAIAKMVIALAETLNLNVIAEGVELAGQRAFLEAHRCFAYQGYLYSRPLPVTEFEAWLRQRASAAIPGDRSPAGQSCNPAT